MNSKILKIWILVLGVALSSCGKSQDDASSQGSGSGLGALPPPNEYCAPFVVNAYNDFAFRCNSLESNNSQLNACRLSAEYFVRNYGGINCAVVPLVTVGYDGQFLVQFDGQQVFQITDRPMRSVLEALDQFNLGRSDWRKSFRRWPRARPNRHGGRR